MMQGLPVIGLGLLVVLLIILSMFAAIELILKFDYALTNRSKRARAPRKVAQPKEPSREPDGSSDDVIAAIGLALHQHLSERAVATSPASDAALGFGSPAWASAGRTEIMRTRHDMTNRYRRGGERGR